MRKTQTSLAASSLVSFRKRVLAVERFGAHFFGGNSEEPPAYRYPNGSTIVVGGMDRDSKIMSSEYDVIFPNEATELTIDDWEALLTRLRSGTVREQIIGDCNPGPPTHWLNQRANSGGVTRLLSRHEDNPRYFTGDGQMTSAGIDYISGTLDRLTGVRHKRLRLGLWVAAEGQVYEGWDPAAHVIDRFEIPSLWPRYWVVDFGFVHPFVWQAWAKDPDGRLFRYREIYMSQRLVEDHALQVRALTASEPRPVAVICDHDAEGRATFERYAGVETEAAHKAVKDGIQAVAGRLRHTGGSPRVFFLRDSLVERDQALAEKALPACTEEEFPDYVWDERMSRRQGEEPVKEHDHGVDATRYLVAHVDKIGHEDDVVRVWSYSGERVA